MVLIGGVHPQDVTLPDDKYLDQPARLGERVGRFLE